MSDYDNDLIEQMVRDGVRTRGGQHVREPVWEREGRDVQCLPCGDQGCDFCNEPVISNETWTSLVEYRENPGDGERDWRLDR